MQSSVNLPVLSRRALRWLGIAVLIVAALWFAARIPRTLTVFVIAAFIAFGVAPVVRRLERRMPRALAIAIVYVALLVIIVVLALLVIPATVDELQSLANGAPDYVRALQTLANQWEEALRTRFGREIVPPSVADLGNFVSSRVGTLFAVGLASVGSILIGTFTALFVSVSALVLSSFFLMQGEAVAATAYTLLPAARRATARALADEVARIFGGYVAGQAILCAIVGVAIFALTAAVGFKYALLVGIIGGIAYAVPFIGQIFIHALALVLAAPQGGWMIVWTQLIIFVLSRIADNVLVPKVMSESIGVSPIVVMFAVFAGGELFGLPGLLLGIPAAALIKVVWKFTVATRAADKLVLPGDPVERPAPASAETRAPTQPRAPT